MNRKLLALALAAAFSATIIGYRFTVAAADGTAPADPPATIMIAGTIRNTGSGWYVVTDARHHPLNLTVQPHGHSITINYPKGLAVITLLVGPDEQFARQGIIVGAHVGTDYAMIWMAHYVRNRSVLIDTDTVRSKVGNIWILGYMERMPATP